MISIYTIIGFSLVMSLAHGMQKVVSASIENERLDFVNGAQNNISLAARAAEEPSAAVSSLDNDHLVYMNIEGESVVLPLQSAVMSRDESIVAACLDAGASLEEKNNEGFTPLHLAAQEGFVSILKLLVERGAQLGARTSTGLTALHMCGYKGAIEYILGQQGDLLDATTLEGFTPLHTALANGLVHASEILLGRGASVDAVTKKGLTPVHIAAQKGYIKILQRLVASHAAIEVKTHDGSTALHLAAAGNQVDMVKYLINSEPGLRDLRNSSDLTALHVAAQNGHLASVEALLAAGASIDDLGGSHKYCDLERLNSNTLDALEERDVLCSGHTLLHFAAQSGQLS